MNTPNPQFEEAEALRKKALQKIAEAKKVMETSRQVFDETQRILGEVRAKRQPREDVKVARPGSDSL